MAENLNRGPSRPQRPRSFWSAPRIATSGQVQQHSSFKCICKHNRLRPEPIRFVRLDSEHAQSDGKSVNRGVGFGQRSRFLMLTKRSVASGDENEPRSNARACAMHSYPAAGCENFPRQNLIETIAEPVLRERK